jgi:hypothetical protein
VPHQKHQKHPVARNVRAFRSLAGLSQTGLAARMQPPSAATTISNIERGMSCAPSLRERIASALGVHPDDLTEPGLNEVEIARRFTSRRSAR